MKRAPHRGDPYRADPKIATTATTVRRPIHLKHVSPSCACETNASCLIFTALSVIQHPQRDIIRIVASHVIGKITVNFE